MSGATRPNNKHLMVCSGRAYPELADEVAQELGVELVPSRQVTYANSEIYVQFQESVRGCDASGASSCRWASTWSRLWPTTTTRFSGSRPRAAATAHDSMGRPATRCSNFDVADFMRVPPPAASTMTAATPSDRSLVEFNVAPLLHTTILVTDRLELPGQESNLHRSS